MSFLRRTTTARIYWVNQFAVPPDQPGGTRHFDMARELLRLGFDVHLVASDLVLGTRQYSRRAKAADPRPIRQTIAGVPFVWLSAGRYDKNDWRRALSMMTFALGSFLYLLVAPAPRGSVYIGSSPQLFSAFGTWLASVLRRRPFVLEVRDLWPESYTAVSGTASGALVRLMAMVAKVLYRRAALIVVLAEKNGDVIATQGGDHERIRFVPNGVDLEEFVRAELSVAPLRMADRFTFVYAGAHGPANDLATVIDACDRLRERGRDDLRVVLLGDGPSKLELVSYATTLDLPNLEFRDPVPKAQIGPLLATADAGLMVLAPADLFTFGVSPNKLFDYMGADLPIVTNVPGFVASVVEEAGVGVVCEPGDPDALADAMEAVVAALRDDAQQFRGGRAHIEAHFDRKALAGRLADYLHAIGAA